MWELSLPSDLSYFDSLTIDDWNFALSNISEDKACGIRFNNDAIVIRNNNKIYAKKDFDKAWFDSIKPQINGVCDVIIESNDKDKIKMIE